MTHPRKFSGRTVYDPTRAAHQAEQHSIMLAGLETIAADLTPGINQSAPRTVEHRQRDNRSCFYVALIGVRQAFCPETTLPTEGFITHKAERAGLLGQYGAKTFFEHFDAQTRLVRDILGLEIRFIDQRHQTERVKAVTHGIHRSSKPVIFGTNQHWVALDGFDKGYSSFSWIGMDPASGQRFEDTHQDVGPNFVLDRLLHSGLPTVVVEGMVEQRPRFKRAFTPTPNHERFRPAA